MNMCICIIVTVDPVKTLEYIYIKKKAFQFYLHTTLHIKMLTIVHVQTCI